MSIDYQTALESHKGRIELFISKYEQLVAENMRLKEKISTMADIHKQYELAIETRNRKIKELEQKIDNLLLTGAFCSTAADVREARRNIGRLVREIDRCIALLNR